jgi:hypothetical protein
VLLLLVMVQPEQDIRKTKATTHHKCEVIWKIDECRISEALVFC